MKKYLLFLLGVFFVFGANAEGVILSDTSIDEDISEESFSAPQSTQSYQSQQIQPSVKSVLSNDMSDPLFLIGDNSFLSDTYVSYMDSKMRVGQFIGYGINPNLALHVNMHYQLDFTRERENGFSSTEFGGVYRINHGIGQSRIISDALFGVKLFGSSHVRTPEYADSSYFAGFRFGRQYTGITLAGTVKSTWVFDDTRGLSYIDFMPEMYFRFQYDWRAGIGADFRKSTNALLLPDQEWLNIKVLRQYGNTQYVGKFDYEFESEEVQVGFDVKILF